MDAAKPKKKRIGKKALYQAIVARHNHNPILDELRAQGRLEEHTAERFAAQAPAQTLKEPS